MKCSTVKESESGNHKKGQCGAQKYPSGIGVINRGKHGGFMSFPWGSVKYPKDPGTSWRSTENEYFSWEFL
jgi:hypothetical protein